VSEPIVSPPEPSSDAAFEVGRTTFGMVPDWVDESITDGYELRVYVRLARKYANARTRECYPSQQALATELGIGLRTVQRAIAGLIRHGVLVVTSRQRREDGSLGRNRYWLPMDQPRITAGQRQPPHVSPGVNGSEKPPGQHQPPSQAHGPAAQPGGQPAAQPGGSTNQTHKNQTQEEIPVADAPDGELPLDLPRPEPESQDEEKPPTINQLAVRVAQRAYDRAGGLVNMGQVIKLAKTALGAGYEAPKIDEAVRFLQQQNWKLTTDNLRQQLNGGPRRPQPTTTREVRDHFGHLLEGPAAT
jgi:Helix-turn-helix domain